MYIYMHICRDMYKPMNVSYAYRYMPNISQILMLGRVRGSSQPGIPAGQLLRTPGSGLRFLRGSKDTGHWVPLLCSSQFAVCSLQAT